MQDFASDESQSVSVDDFFSQTKTKKIKLSDGIGTDSTGQKKITNLAFHFSNPAFFSLDKKHACKI